MNAPSSRRYFAASNSCEGFRNYFGECFSPRRVDRLYVVKGGPGTGKSHLLRAVARRARGEGYDVTEYLCSSDPSSLDGILLRAEGRPTLGLLDATPPHVTEPTLPGVREELVDLGRFWDASCLRAEGESIRALTEAKEAAYDRAYDYLRACGALEEAAHRLTKPCVRWEALAGLAARLTRRLPTGEGYDPLPALRRSVGMTGETCLHTFEWEAESLLAVEDYYGLGAYLAALVLERVKDRRLRVLLSHDPVCPDKADGLLLPESGLCLLVGDAEPPATLPTRVLSLRRYADPAALREVRPELRRLTALRQEMKEGALSALASAAEAHFALETIYKTAMDFPAKEAFTEALCDRVLEG